MRLHLVDYHLEACRLFLVEAKSEKVKVNSEQQKQKEQEAAQHLETAAKLIKETGYHRRDAEVQELQEQIKNNK